MSFKFEKIPDEDSKFDFAKVCFELEGSGYNLDQVLEEFQNFLKASGYVFKGNLEIVEEEEIEDVKL